KRGHEFDERQVRAIRWVSWLKGKAFPKHHKRLGRFALLEQHPGEVSAGLDELGVESDGLAKHRFRLRPPFPCEQRLSKQVERRTAVLSESQGSSQVALRLLALVLPPQIAGHQIVQPEVVG